MDRDSLRNTITFIVLSVIILIAYQTFVLGPQAAKRAAEQRAHAAATPAQTLTGPAANGFLTPAQALAGSPRIRIDTPKLSGSIALAGARFDDLSLNSTTTTRSIRSRRRPAVASLRRRERLLCGLPVGRLRWKTRARPAGQNTPWTAPAGRGADAGDAAGADLRQWPGPCVHADDLDRPRTTCSPSPTGDQHRRATGVAGAHGPRRAGRHARRLPHRRRQGAPELDPGARGRHRRHRRQAAKPELHLCVRPAVLQRLEEGPADRADQRRRLAGGHRRSTGWRRWSLRRASRRTRASPCNRRRTGPTSTRPRSPARRRPSRPARSATRTTRFFAGPKIVPLLQDYQKTYGIPRFDQAVDWGVYWFFTRPIFLALEFFNGYLGNIGLCDPGADRRDPARCSSRSPTRATS